MHLKKKKKNLIVLIDIFVNQIFHAAAPTIKPSIKVFHNVWIKTCLFGLIPVIPRYWFLIFYWYYARRNLVGQNDMTSRIYKKKL